MNTLSLTIKITLQQRLDCTPLTPCKLNNLTQTEIASIPLYYGKAQLRVDEVFELDFNNNPAISSIIFNDANEKMDCIGANMSAGELSINGNAGNQLGFKMSAGKIFCSGNVGEFAGCGMSDGFINIHGNVGDFLGAALTGERKGMRGGTIIIKGNAGDRVGDQMRRGLILIEGNAGDYCGSRMIAGTIGVLGTLGQYTAYSMRRGTLLLKTLPTLHATVQDCGTHTLPYLSLLFNSFKRFDTPFNQIKSQRVQRYVGDLGTSGNGEILIIQ
ncbi:MAG: formylmethanofuran dehydrogenase subunit C [Methylophilaceae bacterium]|nr:formylmethanofuran dehydrogenase subunit C [Methylophilaceae bacterium]